jgi:hypothetical protein
MTSVARGLVQKPTVKSYAETANCGGQGQLPNRANYEGPARAAVRSHSLRDMTATFQSTNRNNSEDGASVLL